MEIDKILKGFLDELGEMQKELHEKLISLEINHSDYESIEAIFRITHTIKSNASFFGMDELKSAGDKLENLLEELRSGGKTVDKESIGLLLEAVAFIDECIESVKSTFAKGLPARQFLPENAETSGADTQTQKDKKSLGRGSITFKCGDTDVTQTIMAVNDFFSRAKEYFIDIAMVNKFVNALDSLLKISEEKGYLENARLLKQMCFDFAMISNEADTVNPYLVDLLNKNFLKVVSNLRTSPDISSKSVVISDRMSDILNLPKSTFRIEEDNIDELIVSMRKFEDVEQSLRHIRDKLTRSKAAPEEILELQKVLNSLNFLSRDSMQKLIKIKVTSPKLLLEKIGKLIAGLASSFGKKAVLQIKGEDIFVERAKLEILENALIHIVRNCLDHGIETVEERLSIGKPEAGIIVLELKNESDNFIIAISDDGRGIDFCALKEDALRKGKISPEEFDSMDNKKAVRLLFLPGISAKNEVTEVSGRGIGMDVVYRIIKDAGGSIDVHTELGKGTRFVFTFPKNYS